MAEASGCSEAGGCYYTFSAVVCIRESKMITGMGHFAWTSCRIQEAGKALSRKLLDYDWKF